MTNIFDLLGSPIRIKILSLLLEGAYCVNHISKTLNISQPSASQHLKILKDKGFVVCERDAQRIRYKISSDKLKKFLNKLISETKNLEVIL